MKPVLFTLCGIAPRVARRNVFAVLCLFGALSACERKAAEAPKATKPLPARQEAPGPQPMTRAEAFARARELGQIGRVMFFDPSLSASGRVSCASCHDPAHGFSPPNALPIQAGGSDLSRHSFRAAPTLMYRQSTPAFTEHYYESDDEADDSIDNGPTGGLTWDGRVDRGRAQAAIPLLSPDEMANADAADVVAKAARAPYAERLRKVYGSDLFDDPKRAFAALTEALEVFEESPADFYPYSSKYDAFLAGKTQLSPAEARGLQIFNDERKGNCANCHRSMPAKDGTPPQFTDFGLIGLGVPRNRALAQNRDPTFFDLGACGPLRTDLAGRDEYCGLFKTPTLRNVALRKTFFHNGSFHDLTEVVRFYAQRNTNPEKWYPRKSDGSVDQFDDLPQKYWKNLNDEPPFDRKRGERPAMNEAEIRDVVAFLHTLTDGWQADTGRAKGPAATAVAADRRH